MSKKVIYSPLCGDVVKIEDVNDPVFAGKMMGDGIAIVPSIGELRSPVNGTVKMIFETLHAIGILSDDGVELLMHIGLDTVDLNGKPFKSHINVGQKVSVGDILISFNIDEITKEGYDITTPVIITNTVNYSSITKKQSKNILFSDELLMIE